MSSRVLDSCTMLRVQSWDIKAAVPSRVEQALGIPWPKLTGTVATGCAEILCLGPTDWLIVAANSDTATLLEVVTDAFRGSSFRVTNVSQALSRIHLEKPHARSLLSKACALDVAPEFFPPGRSVRTRVAGIPVVVRCMQALTFECIVSVSYCEYLSAWFKDAATEFMGTVA